MASQRWKKVEQFWEDRILFGARWVLAPAYLALGLALIVLAGMSVMEFVQLVLQLRLYDESDAVAQVLVIVDLVLVMNLVLMIMFVGYVNFVSVIRAKKSEDWPEWMGALDYSGLKIQVLGSIIAIAAIKLLRAYLDLSSAGKVDTERLMWMTIINITFVFSVLILSASNRLHVKAEASQVQRFSGRLELERNPFRFERNRR
jgi:uncharacterized protein (TIGR00645 family)